MAEPCENGLVSTIIPVYNRPGLLREAVQSVLSQTYRPIEVIISDDGSTDETPEVAGELALEHLGCIRVVRNQNRGAGAAREAGRELARGEFIQYLDSDDLLLPTKFETLVSALHRQADCGIAYGITRLMDAGGGVLREPYKWTAHGMTSLFPALLVDRWWNTHTPLFRRSVCDRVGPWKEMGVCEDWEYDARVGALGTRLHYCNEVLSGTRRHESYRLTGGGLNRGKLKDISHLIQSLYDCAVKAGVEHECREMRHFSRWAFLVARQTGAAGLPERSSACFDIARKAAGAERAAGRDFRSYAWMARTFGWTLTGKLSRFLDRVLSRKPGTATMKQSWMES